MKPEATSPRTAVRTERGPFGFRDEIEFFGPRSQQMLGCTHLPLGEVLGGVVICSSLRAEFETNYRREVLLGRALARQGVAVQRFQYLGTGNSDGATSDVTLQTMEADAAIATEWLMEKTGLKRIAFMGTRWGATIAAAMASRYGDCAVVLWQPIVDPAKHFKEIFRARRLWAAKETGLPEFSTEGAAQELQRHGSLDVLGYPIDLPLYASAMSASIERQLGAAPRSALIVQIGGSPSSRSKYEALAERLRNSGLQLQYEFVDEEESWWLEAPGERQEKRLITSSPTIEVTTKWLVQSIGQDGGVARGA